jgi:hypothetical protein
MLFIRSHYFWQSFFQKDSLTNKHKKKEMKNQEVKIKFLA